MSDRLASLKRTTARIYLQPEVHRIVYGFDRTLTQDDFEDYQWWMSDLMVEHEAVLLGAFMGSGKTVSALHAAKRCQQDGIIRKILIVAPLNVAKDTWPDEIMAWDFARGFSYAVIVGNEEERLAALERAFHCDITIINRENYRWLCQKVRRTKWVWDCLIYDEASRLKGGEINTKPSVRKDGTESAPRRSEFGFLVRTRRRFKRVWELSGTPASNGLIDLWGPVYVLDGGERLGASKSKFHARWFEKNPYTRAFTPQDHAEGEIMGRLKDIMFCLREEDFLELPPLVVKDRWVTLEPKHQRMYERFRETLALDEFDVEAVNNGVLANKLLQFANGSVYAEEDGDPEEGDFDLRKKSVARHIHNRKLDELGSVFEEASGRPVLIAYSYKFDVEAIKKRYPFCHIFGTGKRDTQDWNRGKFKAMLMHPASAGHGLNFQYGSNIACWYGLNWSLELYQQFNRRLARRGQQADSVWLYRILARRTMDERTAKLLETKGATQDRIVDAVRVTVEQVRRMAA